VTVPKGFTEGKVELALAANTKPGTYTFTINGAGQVPRDYTGKPSPKTPNGNNTRVVYPGDPITITVAAAPAPTK